MSHVVTLEFVLGEEVSPEFLAKRVAEACGAYYALRPGEHLRFRNPNNPHQLVTFTVTGDGVCEGAVHESPSLRPLAPL